MSHIKDTEYSGGMKPMRLEEQYCILLAVKLVNMLLKKNLQKAAGVTGVTIRTKFRDLKAKKSSKQFSRKQIKKYLK